MARLEMIFDSGAQRGEVCYGHHNSWTGPPCLISPHSGLGMKHENTTNAFLRAQEVWGDQQGTMD